MKKLNLLIALAITVLIPFYGCQTSDDDAVSTIFSRQEVVDMLIANPKSRLEIWDKITAENKYRIWADKINQVTKQSLKPEWRSLFDELQRNFTFEKYLEGVGANSTPTYLGTWIEEFSEMASEEERTATIGSLYDYNAITNSIDDQTIIKIEEHENSSPPITNRSGLPGQNQNCDCKWTDCDMTGEYCCKPSTTTGCNPTTIGCGMIWLQSCTNFCLSRYAYNCDDF